jgi:hypothetical protein
VLLAIGCAAALVAGISVAGAGPAKRRATVSDEWQRDFGTAATEFGVPSDVLLAVSYALTGWAGDATGGFGPMHLTDVGPAAWSAAAAGQGRDLRAPAAPVALAAAPGLHTLSAAAQLIGVPADRLRTDVRQNIRGGAALLARYATEATGGALPTTVLGWYGAIARYGTGDPMAGRAFADDVLGLLRAGVPHGVVAGQALGLDPRPTLTLPAGPRIPAGFAGADPVDCPPVLDCRFVPAAYAWNDRTDPTGYGSYDPANRPQDGTELRYIVLGDTGGTYDAAVAAAQQPTSGHSAHYLVRAADGQVSQLVRTRDIAWHAGNWAVNVASVGIAVEGVPAAGGRAYTDRAYRSAAELVRWLAATDKIPLDREHVLGHDEVPGVTDGPGGLGERWDWTKFMALLGQPVRAQAFSADRIVTVAAAGATVPVRTAPRPDAPLAGTAVAGASYAVAARKGTWTAIWFGGRQAWLADPTGRLTVPGDGTLVSPLPSNGPIPVYAEATPELTAYPGSVTATEPVQVGTIAAGQKYVATAPVTGQDYYARFDAAGQPANHTVVLGSSQYVMITFDHRRAYLAAEDVVPADVG